MLKVAKPPRTFQDLLLTLQRYWAEQGCVILQPYDMEVGAGTFHTATFLRAVGPEPWSAAYVQPSRRPTDGRYGDNPFRLQHYYQYQVAIKPSPPDMIELYLGSLRAVGIDPLVHDVRLVEDNWESPTLGAWGLGWEIWLNGMEVTQFTYFQQVGGLDCRPVMGEITYGLERLAMYLQGVESVFDLVWTDGPLGRVTYGDVYHQNEVEQSKYNFEYADVDELFRQFDAHEKECLRMLEVKLALPAYERMLKTSHTFNLLDARKAISVTERQRYILRVRTLARGVAEAYYASREALGFPMLQGKGATPAAVDAASVHQARRSATARERGLPDGRPGMSASRDFLVEIGTEELPPKSLLNLSAAFAEGVAKGLKDAGVAYKSLEAFATPRRLAVRVKKLIEQQPDRPLEKRGPPVKAAFDANGAPTQAALAFARGCGVEVSALEKIETPKGEWLVFRGTETGARTVDLLPGIVTASLDALPIAKRMRWGAGEAQFVRPVHWVLMLWGNDVVETEILGQKAGNLTYGHRFMAPKALKISSPASYVGTLLKRGKVMADVNARRDSIRAGVTAAAEKLDGIAVIDDALLDEVTGLVEWPVPLAGRFDPQFLELPAEVPIATMQEHQRYFPVRDAQGKLMPWFITVSNIESRDPSQVIAGNERVVRPRLTDAAFFYKTDRQQPLSAHVEALKRVTFQTQLGSQHDKSERVRTLAKSIAATIGGDPALADRAAELSKCDLLTNMVGEFPELQGLMGRYYALHDHEPAEVAEALREQYLPRFAGDALPATRTGMALSIADKLDTIAGIYATGPEADRHARSVRPASCGARPAAHVDRARARPRPAATDRPGRRRGAGRYGACGNRAGQGVGRHRCRKARGRGLRLRDRTPARLLRRRQRRHHRDGRDVRRRAGDPPGVGARFRCPAARAGAVPAAAGRREPRGRQQAHRQHPEEGDGAGRRSGRRVAAHRPRGTGAGRAGGGDCARRRADVRGTRLHPGVAAARRPAQGGR